MQRCTSIKDMVMCNPAFLKSSPRSASVLGSPLLLIVFAVFCFGFLIFFLQRNHIFIAVNLSLTYECIAVLTKLDSAAFSSVRKGRRTDITDIIMLCQ